MSVPTEIGATEVLGHRSFSMTQAQRAARGAKIRPHYFRPPDGVLSVSMDRLTLASADQEFDLISVADADGRRRQPPRQLQGWLALPAGNLRGRGRCLRASPTDDNRYHSEIVLPPAAVSRDELDRHTQDLANLARNRWLWRRDWPHGIRAVAFGAPGPTVVGSGH